MPGRHLDHQFDTELEDLTRRVLSMGGLVENQIAQALYCIAHPTPEVVQRVLQREVDVNAMELEIDRKVCAIITRRQPTAMDLRLLMALSKTAANLERAGDEAVKVTCMSKAVRDHNRTRDFPTSCLRIAGDLASEQLSKSLDALARMDAAAAVSLLADDQAIKVALEGFVLSMITCMANDSRSVHAGLDLLFAAKAIERIGAHARNLAEFTIYAANGLDVRHASRHSESTSTVIVPSPSATPSHKPPGALLRR